MKGETKKEISVPNLRFKEFETEWEEKKLGEVSTFYNGRAYKQSELLSEGKYPVLRVGNLFTNENWYYSDLELDETKYIYDGDLIYAWSASFGPRIWKGLKAIYHYHIWKVEVLVDLIDKDFYHILLGNETTKMKSNSSNGFALLHITKGTIENWQSYLPSMSEQQKIVSFLSLIQERIETQSKIIDDLRVLKTAVGKRVFSKKDEWEVKKLGEMADIKRGASPRPISDLKWFDETSAVGWVRISDVKKSNKYLEKTEQYLSDEGISRSRLVQRDNLIMSICATIGKPIYTKFDVCIHDGFVVFENLKLNKEYLYYYLDFIQANWYRYGQPGTQINLNTEIVSKEEIPCPSLTEQTKIAQFLSAIDQKIKNETAFLNLFIKQKQYLLNQMFI